MAYQNNNYQQGNQNNYQQGNQNNNQQIKYISVSHVMRWSDGHVNLYKGKPQTEDDMRFIKSVMQNGLDVACSHLVIDESQYCETCKYRTACKEVRRAISYIEKRFE